MTQGEPTPSTRAAEEATAPTAPDVAASSAGQNEPHVRCAPAERGAGTPPTVASEPPSEPAAAALGAPAAAKPSPKLIRRVVCSYQLGWLPGEWLQTWRRLDRVFARAQLKVKATLAPLEDLPEDTDILVVPPDLREAAREAARPGTPILVTPASAAAGAFADLVSRLEAGTEFTVDKTTAAEREQPKIVSYRGHTLLD